MESDDDKTQSHIILSKGTMVSHYRIVEKIGAGGMGEVYLAEDTKLNREVALKFLPPHLCQDEDCRARFKREAQAAAKLDHPNIVTIHEVSEYQGRPFFAMQHVEGQSLRDLTKGKELGVDRIIELAIQVCDGLSAAHDKKVVHRDIKPSNIVIDAYGRPKILDFGLAAIQGGEHLTKTGSTLGTIGYMSPEQVRGQEIDHRSDLFSLGVVLYELIAKMNPFKRDTEAATLKAVSDDAPEPLARFKSGLPDGLQAIIDKALEKDVKTRYQHADGMLSDLMRIKRSLDSGLSIVSNASPSRHTMRTRWVVAAFVVIAAAIVLTLTKPWDTETASDQPDKIMLAVLPFENLGSPEDEYFADGITDEITSRLALVQGIGVISRTSAHTFKDSEKTLPEIARQLGVDYILEGTIRWDKTGDTDRVRITPQFIRVSDDRHLWADNYERSLTQIFAVQSEIANHVAAALNVALGKSERLRMETEPTTNVEAYDYFLRGREYFERGGQRNRDELAIRMWERAIELDSSFALAYAWLARAHSYSYFNWPEKGSEKLELAEKAAKTAFRLSNQGPEGHMAMGYYYYYGCRDYQLALEHFSHVLVEQPNNSDAMEATAYIQRRLGRWEESLKTLQRAAELDPRSVKKMTEMQLSSLVMRRYDLARQYFELGCTIAPDAKDLYERESWRCIVAYGDTRRARKVLEDGQRLIGPGQLAEEFELLDIYDRDFQSALKHRPTADAALADDDFDYYLFKGWTYLLMNDKSASVSYFDSARVRFENAVAEAPSYSPHHSQLAIAYAGMGREKDAIRECETVFSLISDMEDALLYPVVLSDMAEVYILTGKHELAIETLDSILSMPFVYSVQTLRLDPIFDPLRDHPRFQALLEKYDDNSPR
ncbi:MAG: protein kinase [candidate division Zixibacteria bacterium]